MGCCGGGVKNWLLSASPGALCLGAYPMALVPDTLLGNQLVVFSLPILFHPEADTAAPPSLS